MTYEVEGDKMTNEEAKESLKLINLKSVHPFLSWEEMKEVRDIAIEALEAADKYKWHDLRKDPKDLPVGYHYQVIFQWVGSNGCIWYDCGWFYTDEQEDEPYFSTHDVHMFIGNGYRHVIAWRYIEPFEEDEQEGRNDRR